jgi:hypothetical protein
VNCERFAQGYPPNLSSKDKRFGGRSVLEGSGGGFFGNSATHNQFCSQAWLFCFAINLIHSTMEGGRSS